AAGPATGGLQVGKAGLRISPRSRGSEPTRPGAEDCRAAASRARGAASHIYEARRFPDGIAAEFPCRRPQGRHQTYGALGMVPLCLCASVVFFKAGTAAYA